MHNITIERSTMFVQQHHIDSFKSIASRMEEYSYIVDECGYNPDDKWIIVFNLWTLLQPEEFQYMENAKKSFIYSANYIILSVLKKNPYYKAFKLKQNQPVELLFLTALYIAKNFSKWTMDVLRKYNLMPFIENYAENSYFDVHLRPKNELKQFIENQAKFTKACVKEMSATDSFSKIVKESFDSAYFLYKTDFLQKQR